MPTDSNEHAEFSVGELRGLKQTVSQGFTHIVLPQSRRWKAVRDALEYDCRLHVVRLWIPIRDVKWEDLRAELHRAVKMDEDWLGKIAPKDLRHALLLPPKCFATNKNTDLYWNRCDAYSEPKIAEAEAILKVVEKEHRRPDGQSRSWMDARKLRYRFDSSKHGRTLADRDGFKSYRFCYEVPPGFHYDVTDENGKQFSIQIDGQYHEVSHCNISPWGHVRRG
jgi:hypothetical protein